MEFTKLQGDITRFMLRLTCDNVGCTTRFFWMNIPDTKPSEVLDALKDLEKKGVVYRIGRVFNAPNQITWNFTIKGRMIAMDNLTCPKCGVKVNDFQCDVCQISFSRAW
jgi:hypothetical protein